MLICKVAELIFKRYCEQFIAALAKLRKWTVSFVTSAYPSICSHGTFRLPMAGFNEISYFRVFRKYRVSIKSFPDYKHLLQENYVEYKHFFFSKCYSTQEVFFQHISTLQHVLLLLHGERLIDNQFVSTCSPTYLQLL